MIKLVRTVIYWGTQFLQIVPTCLGTPPLKFLVAEVGRHWNSMSYGTEGCTRQGPSGENQLPRWRCFLLSLRQSHHWRNTLSIARKCPEFSKHTLKTHTTFGICKVDLDCNLCVEHMVSHAFNPWHLQAGLGLPLPWIPGETLPVKVGRTEQGGPKGLTHYKAAFNGFMCLVLSPYYRWGAEA